MLIAELKFPYIDKILISKKRNPKYYSIKKGVGRAIYKQHAKNKDKKFVETRMYKLIKEGKYSIDPNGFVVNEKKEKILANKRTVGTPKYWVVNFQEIWNNVLRFEARNNIMVKLKEAFKPLIDASGLEPIQTYPLRLELFIYALKMPVDVDNKGAIYFKCIQDILKDGYIIDDSSEYINDTGRIKWIKVEEGQEEFMVFKIYKSDNYAN